MSRLPSLEECQLIDAIGAIRAAIIGLSRALGPTTTKPNARNYIDLRQDVARERDFLMTALDRISPILSAAKPQPTQEAQA